MARGVVLACSSVLRSITFEYNTRRLNGFARVLVLVAAAALYMGCLGCSAWETGLRIPQPRSGVARVFEDLMLPVPGGHVNAYGGNLFVVRGDLAVDTRIGDWQVEAVWNSAAGAWHWNFDSSLLRDQPTMDPIFTDDTGYRFNFKIGSGIGQPVPGSHWVWHSHDAVRTSGGLVHEFDEAGKLASVNWISAAFPALRFVRSSPEAESRLARIDQCTSDTDCSTLYSLTYDARGRLSAVDDLAGRSALYTYDADTERIASARDALDLANGWGGTRYEYDEAGRLVAITNSHDERIEYHYYGTTNAIMKVVQIGEGDPFWRFVYGGMDSIGIAKTNVTDPMGGTSVYSFDLNLRMWSKQNSAGEFWRWQWRGDSYDRISELSPSGVERLFDVVGSDVATETQPSGNIIIRTFAPSPAENRENRYRRAIARIEEDLGLIESRSYSSEGVLESVATGTGDLTTLAYDAAGDLTLTDPAGVVTVYSDRGDHGHFRSVTRGTTTVNYTYDVLGNLLEADGLLDRDPHLGSLSIGQGGIVERSYDADRNIAALVLEAGGASAPGLQSELRIEWRADHQSTLIERPYGGDTEFHYDTLGRRVEERSRVDGSWTSTMVQYDANGRIVAILKPNGMATRLTYRSPGEVVSVRYELDWTDAGEVDSMAVLEYENARLVAIRDTAHAMVPETYSYDAAGFVDEIHYPDGEAVSVSRDLRGRVDLKQYWRADGTLLRSFERDYDLANRQIAVREDGVAILNLTFAAGSVDEILFGNGVAVVNHFDPATGDLTGFTATNEAQQLVASMDVSTATCDIVLPASRCKIERTESLIGVLATSYTEYQLEDRSSERLIADSRGIWLVVDEFYDYDELSNLEASSAGDFIYNPERNRLLRIEKFGLAKVGIEKFGIEKASMEADSSLVLAYEYDEAGYVTARNGVPIHWNGMGRMTALGSDVEMQWDSFGRKISATVAGAEAHWKYGGELVEDEFGSNQRLDLGWAVSRIDDSTHEYRLFDFRGNSKLMLDDEGAVKAHHHYSGYERVTTTGSDESSRGFAAGAHVDELVVIGKRIYDPVARRFLSRDPISQIINQYSYTLGNPVRFWDPGGAEQTSSPPIGYELKTTTTGGGFGVNIFVAHAEFHYEVTRETMTKIPSTQTSPALNGSRSGSRGKRPGNGTCKMNCSSGTKNTGVSTGASTGSGPAVDWSCGLGFEIAPLLALAFWLRTRRSPARRSKTASRGS
ncbi:MAG: hypothetical protein IH881_02625 [Myxococcales bacterium]|nr:hypothetical protein [Myxococcales bacterium]